MHNHLKSLYRTLKHNTDLSLCFFCFFFPLLTIFFPYLFILTHPILLLSLFFPPRINQSWHRKTFIGASIYLTYRVTSKRISMSFIPLSRPLSVLVFDSGTPPWPAVPVLSFNPSSTALQATLYPSPKFIRIRDKFYTYMYVFICIS